MPGSFCSLVAGLGHTSAAPKGGSFPFCQISTMHSRLRSLEAPCRSALARSPPGHASDGAHGKNVPRSSTVYQ